MAVLTRAGLRALGTDDAALRRALRRGELHQVGHDRFADAMPIAVERLIAAPGTSTALFGGSALRAWGLPCDDATVTVAVPHGSRRRALPSGVVVRHCRDWSAVERDGVLVTDLPQTVRHAARELPLHQSVPILDAAARGGLDLGELRAALGSRHRGNERARRALALSDERAESPLESLLRLHLALAGVAPHDLQHVVREGGRQVARVDLWYPGLVVEADGFESHSCRRDYVRDRRKGQAYARLGLLLVRLSWEDVVLRPDQVVATVRAALDQVERRAV